MVLLFENPLPQEIRVITRGLASLPEIAAILDEPPPRILPDPGALGLPADAAYAIQRIVHRAGNYRAP